VSSIYHFQTWDMVSALHLALMMVTGVPQHSSFTNSAVTSVNDDDVDPTAALA